MDRYFYFRDVADEIDDDDNSSSVMVPVKNITGMGPGGNVTSIIIYWKNVKNEQRNDFATLTTTRGKHKEVMQSLVEAMNSGPHHDGVTVIADACTTTNGASSIQGDDVVVASRFLNTDITGVAITAG